MERSRAALLVFAIVASSALVVAPISAPSASAAEVSLDAGPPGHDVSIDYGTTIPDEQRIEVGPATTTLVVTPGLSEEPPGVFCAGSGGLPDYSSLETPWTGRVVVQVDPGTFGSTGGIDAWYRCRSGGGPETSVYSETWWLAGSADAPETVELTADPAKQVQRTDDYTFTGEEAETPRVVQAGDRVTVSGLGGVWPSSKAYVSVNHLGGSTLAPAVVAADRDSFSFVVPPDLPESPFGAAYFVQASADSGIPGDPSMPELLVRAAWSDYLTIRSAEAAASTTRLSLDRHYALSSSTIRATVSVRSEGRPATDGRVRLLVGGQEFRRSLTADDAGDVTFTLPKLRRGLHTVTAVYDGTSASEGSRDRPDRVRILW
ncbi:Ig-like domain-containing protein [Diaminobutyricimonas aerilata]|uniref:Ig-like domain-containing protein n=1 Tax=Diaminobutyricimonas aerilata TaxID=1162967 RepID=A0A2M9CIF0_9MICO|nr:Ig-like domain-containing protein [Diaminobutyricimonas aerilata]PJJ71667.1 Ig-like domain-containing protein [Diaminobutyricimonas aerilata]